MSEDADLETQALRPSVRPWLIAGMVNVLLGSVLLGIPYFRGPQRAGELVPRWSAFAGCFYDAEPEPSPGLGLPPGERGRYASLVLTGGADWPGRCLDELDAIAPAESMFLFPNVKNAEARLRDAIELMRTEIERLQERREAGDQRVPARALRAMAVLRGALAELGVSASVGALSADRNAVRFEADGSHETASIVPLRVSEGGLWSIAMEEGALLTSTMDTRAVVHAEVRDGRVDQRVTRRPRLLTGLLGARSPPWAIWSTSPTTCERTEEGCLHRATGLATFVEDRQSLEPMMWLGAHPLAAPSRSVHVVGRVAYVAALGAERARVMRFELVEPTVRALGEEREIPRLSRSATWEFDAEPRGSLVWLDGSPPELFYAGAHAAGVIRLQEGARPIALEPPSGRGLQAAACGAWRVLVSDEETRVTRLDSTGGSALRAARPLAIVPPEPSSLRVVCQHDGLEVWALSRGALTRLLCDADECGDVASVVEDVAAFDAVAFAGETHVATTAERDTGVVLLRRYRGREAQGAPTVPSPCWSDPADGLCGEPRLATDGDHLIVATRQDEDLRAVKSEDGRHFGPLAGLRQD